MENKTPMQELKKHLENMVQNGGDADLLCVIGLIDNKFEQKEKQVIEDAFTEGNRQEFYDGSETLAQDYYNQKFRKDE